MAISIYIPKPEQVTVGSSEANSEKEITPEVLISFVLFIVVATLIFPLKSEDSILNVLSSLEQHGATAFYCNYTVGKERRLAPWQSED